MECLGLSISLWFVIAGIFTLITFLFLFLIKIITEFYKKELTKKEIFLLKQSAGIKKSLVGPPGLEPGTNTL